MLGNAIFKKTRDKHVAISPQHNLQGKSNTTAQQPSGNLRYQYAPHNLQTISNIIAPQLSNNSQHHPPTALKQ